MHSQSDIAAPNAGHNNPLNPAYYGGWNALTPFPLNVENRGNGAGQTINFLTGSKHRRRILHIHGGNNSTGAIFTSGIRDWMQTGTLYTENSNGMYTGLKSKFNGTSYVNESYAIINWSDDKIIHLVTIFKKILHVDNLTFA